MNKESSGYDPMSVRSLVDDIYSSQEVQDYMRAQRSMAGETSLRRSGKVIRVKTIMNECVAELFGKRSIDTYTTRSNSTKDLNNDSAAENELPVIQDR